MIIAQSLQTLLRQRLSSNFLQVEEYRATYLLTPLSLVLSVTVVLSMNCNLHPVIFKQPNYWNAPETWQDKIRLRQGGCWQDKKISYSVWSCLLGAFRPLPPLPYMVCLSHMALTFIKAVICLSHMLRCSLFEHQTTFNIINSCHLHSHDEGMGSANTIIEQINKGTAVCKPAVTKCHYICTCGESNLRLLTDRKN